MLFYIIAIRFVLYSFFQEQLCKYYAINPFGSLWAVHVMVFAILADLVCLFSSLAQNGLDEVVEFGILLASESGSARLQFLFKRSFRIRFLELRIEPFTKIVQMLAENHNFLVFFR